MKKVLGVTVGVLVLLGAVVPPGQSVSAGGRDWPMSQSSTGSWDWPK